MPVVKRRREPVQQRMEAGINVQIVRAAVSGEVGEESETLREPLECLTLSGKARDGAKGLETEGRPSTSQIGDPPR